MGKRFEYFSVLLQDVPGHDGLQAAQIKSLKLNNLFCSQALPVRKEFKATYKTLQNPYGIGREHFCGVVVTRQLGMQIAVTFANNCHPNSNPGKSYFLYYLLLCPLNEKENLLHRRDMSCQVDHGPLPIPGLALQTRVLPL